MLHWLFVTMLFFPSVESYIKNYCTSTHVANRTDTNTLPSLQKLYVCSESQKDLHCCASNYESITWEQYDPESGQYVDALGYSNNRAVSEKNQTLALSSVNVVKDNGRYRCVIQYKNHSQPITYMRNLSVVQDCGHYDKVPLPIKPYDHQHEVRKGDRVNLQCMGWFGPKDTCSSDFCDSGWSAATISSSGRVGDFNFVTFEVNKRVFSTPTLLDNEYPSNYYSELHITEVREEDFSTIFQCQLMNNVGEHTINVILSEIKPPPPSKLLLTALILPLVLIVVCALLFLFRLDIALAYKEVNNRLRGEQIVIVHSTLDASFSFDLKENVRRHLQSKISHLSEEGQPPIKRSSIFIYILSRNFFASTALVDFLKFLRSGNSVFVLLHTDIVMTLAPETAQLIHSKTTVSWPLQEEYIADQDWDSDDTGIPDFVNSLCSVIKGVKYDVLLMYAYESGRDAFYGSSLRSHLEDLRFSVFSEESILGTERVIEAFSKAKNATQVIVFILTREFFTDRGSHLYCLDTMCEDDYRKMVFILLDPIPTDFLEYSNTPQATIKTIKFARKMRWPLKGAQRIDWRSASVKTFMKRLRLCLPPPPPPGKELRPKESQHPPGCQDRLLCSEA